MQMLDNIRRHSERVLHTAMVMTSELRNRNIHLNQDLVFAAALLHDITKTRSFQTGEDHAATGGKLLNDLGYPEVGDIIRQHIRLDRYSYSEAPTESEIVNYSDKRVLHDQIVSLEVRMEYILNRYGKEPAITERIRWVIGKTGELETKLFRFISFSPNELGNHVNGDRLRQ
jgi:putative nucleotidyltransferase with HDIG domain